MLSMSVADASSANKVSNYATEGTAVCLAQDKVKEINTDHLDYLEQQSVGLLGGKMHLLIGLAQKSKRISHSTSHGETLATAKTIPLAQLTAIRLTEPELHAQHDFRLSPMILMRLQDDGHCPLPVDHVVDCMDLWELACGYKGIPQDKSQRLGVLAIREERRTNRIRRFFHFRTDYMLADLLTKHSGYVSKSLQELLSCGQWTIRSDVRVRHHFGKVQETTKDNGDM